MYKLIHISTTHTYTYVYTLHNCKSLFVGQLIAKNTAYIVLFGRFTYSDERLKIIIVVDEIQFYLEVDNKPIG